MAYRYIDQLAFDGAWTDGPAGAAYSRVARNLEELALDRPFGAGITLVADSTGGQGGTTAIPVGAPFPVAYGPFIFGHTDEVIPTAKLYVRVNEVRVSVGGSNPAGGTDLLYMHATAWSPSGYDLPPPNPEDWALTLTRTTTAATQSLAVTLGGRVGWVGALLWVSSLVTVSAEATGEMLASGPWGAVSVDWSTAPPSAAEDVAPERVCRIYPVVSQAKTGTEGAGPDRLIGFLQASGVSAPARANLHLAPPFGGLVDPVLFAATAPTVKVHTMGIAEVAGVHVEAEPSYLGPPWEAFASQEPCAEGPIVQMVGELNRLGADRVPTWGAGQVRHGVNVAEFWPAGLSLTASYQRLRGWVIASPPPSDNGWRVLLGLVAIEEEGTLTGRREVDVEVRLNAFTPAVPLVTSQAAGTAEPVELVVRGRSEVPGAFPWRPLPHTLWAAFDLGDWGLFGAWVTERVAYVDRERSDLRQVQFVEAELRGASLTYPVVLTPEIRGISIADVRVYPLICCARARGLDEVA